MILISDRQTALFDLDQYECDQLVKWGWLEPEPEELGSSKNLLPNSPVREQTPLDILLPNQPVREQNKSGGSNLQIVKVKGQSYFLTPSKKTNKMVVPRSWYEIKVFKGHKYLYLRWREDKRQKSRCLGRLDALKYSD